MKHLHLLGQIIDYVQRTGSWVVIVVPSDARTASEVTKRAFALYPPGTKYAGRTVFIGKGRLSIVELTHDLKGDGFCVAFLGWDAAKINSKEYVRRAAWSERAIRQMVFDERRGELTVQS